MNTKLLQSKEIYQGTQDEYQRRKELGRKQRAMMQAI